MTEKQIESSMLQWLNAQPGTFAFKINTVGVFDPVRKIYRKNKNPYLHNGTSDIMCCRFGKFIAIEVKRPGEKPTDSQCEFLTSVSVKGRGKAICVSSLDALMEYFNGL